MNCPICNTIIDDIKGIQFCPTCHWELVVIPPKASPALKSDYENQISLFKESCEKKAKIKELREKILNQKELNNHIKKELNRVNSEAKYKKVIMEELKQEKRQQEEVHYNIIRMRDTLEKLKECIREEEEKIRRKEILDNKIEELKTAYSLPFNKGLGNHLIDESKYLENYRINYSNGTE